MVKDGEAERSQPRMQGQTADIHGAIWKLKARLLPTGIPCSSGNSRPSYGTTTSEGRTLMDNRLGEKIGLSEGIGVLKFLVLGGASPRPRTG